MEELASGSSRRQFLERSGVAALALAAPAAFAQGAGAACADPASLGLSQRNRRRSLGYLESSGDPKQHCRACAFFTAGSAGCGTCQLLAGGPVSAAGRCASFAAKPG